jgi:hypothetical protein
MGVFEITGRLITAGQKLRDAQVDFRLAHADTSATLKILQRYHGQEDYMLCPHNYFVL